MGTPADHAETIVFKPSGDTGLTVVLGDEIDRRTSARVLALKQAIEAAQLDGLVETVPTYTSLLVHYNPLETSQAQLIDRIGALDISEAAATGVEQKTWLFPICFDGPDFAPDLDSVASWAEISADDLRSDILAAEQFVYMLGFAPGQPYMGDLPERLAIPRRKKPVLGVPAGSVLIATGKTIIYSVSNPTGWHIIGRTPIKLLDKTAGSPALLSAGDTVRFREVAHTDYEDLERRSALPDFDPCAEYLS